MRFGTFAALVLLSSLPIAGAEYAYRNRKPEGPQIPQVPVVAVPKFEVGDCLTTALELQRLRDIDPWMSRRASLFYEHKVVEIGKVSYKTTARMCSQGVQSSPDKSSYIEFVDVGNKYIKIDCQEYCQDDSEF